MKIATTYFLVDKNIKLAIIKCFNLLSNAKIANRIDKSPRQIFKANKWKDL